MDTLVWTLLLVPGGLLAAAVGFFIARASGTGRKTRELQSQLQAKQAELDENLASVIVQFGETAQKFKTLNDSYVDLHRQLARSASVLCGDLAADTLLEAPLTNAIAADADVEIADADVEIADPEVPIPDADIEIADADTEAADPEVPIADEPKSLPEVEVTEEFDNPDEIPEQDRSLALEKENEVDNSHWVLAMEEVLEKLRQEPREYLDFDEHTVPLRHVS
ncbi:MAG: DUF1043 family protein [Gammaproteobacteria bacterium]|nr:DUF1043 family protein [Gammaproteobacteria bacterium]